VLELGHGRTALAVAVKRLDDVVTAVEALGLRPSSRGRGGGGADGIPYRERRRV
jgi:hypothetical protein